jgi:hypothetical protein
MAIYLPIFPSSSSIQYPIPYYTISMYFPINVFLDIGLTFQIDIPKRWLSSNFLTNISLKCINYIYNISYISRGYYPKGGGEVRVKIRPVSQLKAVTMVDRGSLQRIWGEAFVGGVLPMKVTNSPLARVYTNK